MKNNIHILFKTAMYKLSPFSFSFESTLWVQQIKFVFFFDNSKFVVEDMCVEYECN